MTDDATPQSPTFMEAVFSPVMQLTLSIIWAASTMSLIGVFFAGWAAAWLVFSVRDWVFGLDFSAAWRQASQPRDGEEP